jgi:hypothetical protein
MASPIDSLFHQRRRARAAMLANAALGILLERFVRFGRRLRLSASVPTRLISFFFCFLYYAGRVCSSAME